MPDDVAEAVQDLEFEAAESEWLNDIAEENG